MTLLLNQVFYPDVQATAQHATDLARALTAAGCEVTVIASRQASSNRRSASSDVETWAGIRIHRVATAELGKSSRWRRAVTFASFFLSCAWKLARIPSHDTVIAMTSPPLITVLGAAFTAVKGGRFIAWIMDLNPDEAIAVGWLDANSLVSRCLHALMKWSLCRAESIIVLDRFMKARLESRLSLSPGNARLVISPPGARSVAYDCTGRSRFRHERNLAGKFVLMYSGNHSPCHPLTTLLEAAKRLRNDRELHFCFVGGGSEFASVQAFAQTHRLSNITTLSYVPEHELAASLSSADLHAVILGDSFVGIVHPSKIYNVLAVGIPVLYIGPPESHITDLAPPEAVGRWLFSARHGDLDQVVAHILTARSSTQQGDPSQLAVAARFHQDIIVGGLQAAVLANNGSWLPMKPLAEA